MTLSALLFDLDGTLVDSDAGHFHAFRAVARRYDVDITEDYFFRSMSGHSNSQICATLFPRFSVAEQNRVADEKEEMFRAQVAELRPIAGLHALLDWAAGQGMAQAVVSNAPQDNITAILEALGIGRYFAAQVSGESLARGKPDPLPYRTALERLGVEPAAAVAFEDAVPGLTAAVRADIATVGMLTSQTAEALTGAGATLVARDFADPGLAAFLDARWRG